MHIGVALPSAIPGASSQLFMEWARKADAGPFSSLAVLDRMAYQSYEPFTALAAAAALTKRIRLATIIAVGPLRNTALLAKVTASIDALSQGRLTVGLAVGARKEDYDVLGISHKTRGKTLTEQLPALRAFWNDSLLGPKPIQHGGPPLLLGGQHKQVYQRIARYADGFIGGSNVRQFAHATQHIRAAWTAAGRSGQPQLWALGYYVLGEEAIETGKRYLRDYYAFAGPGLAQEMAAHLLTSPQAITHCLHEFEEVGCDEFIFFPTVADLAQLERLTSIIHERRQA